LYTQESSRGRGVRVLCLANTKSWDTSVHEVMGYLGKGHW